MNAISTAAPGPASVALTDATADTRPIWRGGLYGAGAITCVGSSVAVSAELAHAPYLTGQAVRYAAGSLLLWALARLTGRRVVAPKGLEWVWIAAVTATGLVGFNVALVAGSAHAEAAVLGVAIATVPVILALIGPLLEGRRPSARILTAAVVVTAGAALVQGAGHSDGVGLLLAVVVLLCEAGFTLLAIPVLPRHGAFGLSVHTTWLAALTFTALGAGVEGPRAVLHFDAAQLWSIGYLAVVVTAAAFALWYTGLGILGPSRAGLLTGLAPVSAVLTSLLLGHPAPSLLVWCGMGVVGCGLALGLTG